jgi:uncharacterized membrane protein
VSDPRRTANTLIVGAYDRTSDAEGALDEVRRMSDAGDAEIHGAVVVTRAADGAIDVPGMADRTGRSAGWGTLAGAAVGVLFPPSLIGSALVGGAVGAVTGRRRSRSARAIADAISNTLPPSSAGLIAITDTDRMDDIDRVLHGSRRVTKNEIGDDVVDKLRAASDG